MGPYEKLLEKRGKKKAYGLLLAIVVLNLGVVFVLVLLNEWNNSFYTALQDYAVDEIFHQLWRFTILAFSYIILAVYAYYLQQDPHCELAPLADKTVCGGVAVC